MNEKPLFVKVMGNYPLTRVISFLITFREFDYPLTEIAENSGVGWTTIHTFFPKLVETGIVVETRRIGRAKLYKLNKNSLIVKKLIELNDRICAEFAEKIIRKEERIPVSVKV